MLWNTAYADTTNTTATTAVAPGAPVPPQPSLLSLAFPMGLMLLVFYFLMFRPQQKKMKEHEAMVNALQKGEEVITQAGLFGKVVGVADRVLTIEIADNVKVKMLKNQVASVVKADQKF